MESLKARENAPRTTPALAIGVIQGYCDKTWTVELADGIVRHASMAASCLLRPRPQDRVSLIVEESNCWITAVLHRVDGGPMVVAFNEDTELDCPNGRLTVRAKKGIDMISPAQVQIKSPLIRFSASMAEHCYRFASWIGDRLETTVSHIRSVSRSHHRVTEQNNESARISIRKIEQVDRTEAGQVDCRAQESLSLRGGLLLAKARKLAKIDGDQIQLG